MKILPGGMVAVAPASESSAHRAELHPQIKTVG